MNESDFKIPVSTLRRISEDNGDSEIILLMRHSIRGELPENDVGYDVPITERGREIAQQLGEVIGTRLKSIHTSPVGRCVQTAEALRSGAGSSHEIKLDRLLGDPGIFVCDGRLAFNNWKLLGQQGVMAHMINEVEALPGMVNTQFGAQRLIQHMFCLTGGEIGIHVFVTHDTLVEATVAKMFERGFAVGCPPVFLESAFFWKDGNNTVAAYRDEIRLLDGFPNFRFDHAEIVDFARIELGLSLGFDCNAHFFIAGGTFKTLISGKPTRDLDIWAASESDRQVMIDTLLTKGAQRLSETEFSETFIFRNRMLDIPRAG